MSYMALYRKFRPQNFDQVKGQDHVVRTLKNQIKNDRIGHAYLFTGTRGTGKTSVAKLFAKAVNCLHPVDGEPCNECENCRAISQDSFIDVAEVDAASNTGVDDMRRIIEEVNYTPAVGKKKVYIIDEAHMLSNQAFNAFLKTLEEPPSYVIFILATTEPHKIPVTIMSRTQRYDFHRISNQVIAENLAEIIKKEGIEAEKTALSYIARAGDGSMRDSISLLDKCISFSLGEKLTYDNVLETLGAVDTDIFSRMFRAVYAGNAHEALCEVRKAVFDGRDLTKFISDFTWYIRNLMLLNSDPDTGADVFGVSTEALADLKKDAKAADPDTLMRYIRVLSELQNDLRGAVSAQILTEVAVIKLAKPQMETDISSLTDRVRQLEAGTVTLQSIPSDKQRTTAVAADDLSSADTLISTQENGHFRTAAAAQKTAAEDLQDDLFWTGAAAANTSADTQREDYFEAGAAASEGTRADLYKNENTTERQLPRTGRDAGTGDFSAGTADKSGDRHTSPAQLVAACWSDIADACGGHMLKTSVAGAKAAADSEDSITVYVNGSMAADSIKSNMQALKDAVKKVTGADIQINVSTEPYPAAGAVSGKRRSPEELLKNINFDIRMED